MKPEVGKQYWVTILSTTYRTKCLSTGADGYHIMEHCCKAKGLVQRMPEAWIHSEAHPETKLAETKPWYKRLFREPVYVINDGPETFL